MGSLESDTTERLHFHLSLSCIGEGNGNPLQCSCLENPRDGGAWWAAVYGVAQSRTLLKWLSSSREHESQTRLSVFTFTFHFHALEKEMATHSSVLAWRVPGTGRLVGCRLWGRRVGHDWSDTAAAAADIGISWVWEIGLMILNKNFFYSIVTYLGLNLNSTMWWVVTILDREAWEKQRNSDLDKAQGIISVD